MSFKFNFEERLGNGTESKNVADGTYEAVINEITEDVAKTGTKFLNVSYIIRNDVEQKYQNAYIWDRIWQSKETGKYSQRMLNTLGWAAKLDPNKEYNSLDAVLADLKRKPMKLTVKNEKSEYNGQTYENLNIKRTEQSDFPIMRHQFKGETNNVPAELNGFASVVDVMDDLPF